MFAILADVCNGRGFAGCKTGDGFNIIDEPRGLPNDVSSEVKSQAESWDGDGHSHSWFTLAELESFDWDQTTKHEGWVNYREFVQYIKLGHPTSWCGGVSGGDIKHVSINEMMEYVKNDTPSEYEHCYTLVSWVEKYRDSVESFLTETIPKMKALGDARNVRAVFWFDN